MRPMEPQAAISRFGNDSTDGRMETTPHEALRRFVQRFPLTPATDAKGSGLVKEVVAVPPSLARFGFPEGVEIEKWANETSRSSPVPASMKSNITGREFAVRVPVPMPGSPVAIHYLARKESDRKVVATTLDYLYTQEADAEGGEGQTKRFVGGTDEPALLWLLYHRDPTSLGAWGRGGSRPRRPVPSVVSSTSGGLLPSHLDSVSVPGGGDQDECSASILPGILHFAVSTMKEREVARFKVPAALLPSSLLALPSLPSISFLSGLKPDENLVFDVCLEGAEEPLPPPPALMPRHATLPDAAASDIEEESHEDVFDLPDIPGKTRKEIEEELASYRASMPPPLKKRMLAAMLHKDRGNAAFKSGDLVASKKHYDSAFAFCFIGKDEWLYSQHDAQSDDDHDDDDGVAIPIHRFGLSDHDKRRLSILKLQLHLNRAAVHLKRAKTLLAALEEGKEDMAIALKEAEKASQDAEWDCDQALALIPPSRIKPLSEEEQELLMSLTAESLTTVAGGETFGGEVVVDSLEPPSRYEGVFLGLEKLPLGAATTKKARFPFDYASSHYRASVRKASSFLSQASVLLMKARCKQYWDEDKAVALVAQAEELLQRLSGPTAEMKAMLTNEVPLIRRSIKEAVERQKAAQKSSLLAGSLLRSKPSSGVGGATAPPETADGGTGGVSGEEEVEEGEMPPLLEY
jgi:hypothetical protein